MKLAKCVLPLYLANLFNTCIDQDIFSFHFRTAYVTPFPCCLFFPNYLKRFWKKNMSKFIAKNNTLTPFQFGFRENNSTELAITIFYDSLLKSLDENEITCSIFLDFSI